MKLSPLAAGVLAVALTLTASAQRGPAPLPPNPPGPPPPQQLRDLREALNLSPAQAESIRALAEARQQSLQSAQQNLQARLDALAAMQARPAAAAKALESASQALDQASRQLQSVDEKFRADFRNLLSSEQQKSLDQLAAVSSAVNALTRLGVFENAPPRQPPLPPNGPPGLRGRRGAIPPNGPPPNPPNGLFPPNAPFAPPGAPPLPPLAPLQPLRGGAGPANNPITPEKVALGKKLFSDTHLSKDNSVSCATCHDAARAFSDRRPVSKGVGGAKLERNAPSLVNVSLGRSFFWDGRVDTLEQQATMPITNPKEMGLSEKELEQRTGMKVSDVANALASYLRTIRSTESRFDQFQRGQEGVLTAQERAGFELFRGRAGCIACHGGANFTDDQFHNTGVAWRDGKIADAGRFAVSKDQRDRGAFKTPGLREVAGTAPYMHDGSQATLEDVVDFYSDGGRNNPTIDPRMRPLRLSTGEKAALVAFMKTLSSRVTDGF